jgi:transposase-like protein
MRWIQRYAPEFEKRRNRFACQAGRPWRVDETYVKIKGRWNYLYRAVDSHGKTVDFLLRAKRDVAAVKAFFRRAFKGQGRLPPAITLDGYQASHRAAREILAENQGGARTVLRSSKYLNNLVEQDHRSIKLRLGPMLCREPSWLENFRFEIKKAMIRGLPHFSCSGNADSGIIRARSSSALARPYMARLSVFNRLICPSV